MALRNSLWCKDKAGRVGIISELFGDYARFHYANADGTLEPETLVPQEVLTQCRVSDIPATHMDMTPEQAAELGYADAPALKSDKPAVDAPIE